MELALWETLQYFKDATAGRNVNKEKAFKVVVLPPKSLVLQIFFKTVSKAPRSFFLSEYLHPHNIVNKDNYIMYFQKHYSSHSSCSSYQKYDVPQCTHTRHWGDEWNIIIWKENVIYNPNLPRIAYLHIYKLVYSSDVDYKVREEIVKTIVVQNATVPLSRIAPTLPPKRWVNSIARVAWAGAAPGAPRARAVARGCCWTARSWAYPGASWRWRKRHTHWDSAMWKLCRLHSHWGPECFFYRKLSDHQSSLIHSART